jgi:rhodanese-related sulfurtransferase
MELKEMLSKANATITVINVEEAKHKMENEDCIFVDVRDANEVLSEGGLPGSIQVSRGMLEFVIDRSSPYHNEIFTEPKEFIFYCKSGGRSALAASVAKSMGIDRVASMAGGIQEWKNKFEMVVN